MRAHLTKTGVLAYDNGREYPSDEVVFHVDLGWLKIYWSKAWSEYAQEHQSTLSARFVVENLKTGGKDKVCQYAGAENELVNEHN